MGIWVFGILFSGQTDERRFFLKESMIFVVLINAINTSTLARERDTLVSGHGEKII